MSLLPDVTPPPPTALWECVRTLSEVQWIMFWAIIIPVSVSVQYSTSKTHTQSVTYTDILFKVYIYCLLFTPMLVRQYLHNYSQCKEHSIHSLHCSGAADWSQTDFIPSSQYLQHFATLATLQTGIFASHREGEVTRTLKM